MPVGMRTSLQNCRDIECVLSHTITVENQTTGANFGKAICLESLPRNAWPKLLAESPHFPTESHPIQPTKNKQRESPKRVHALPACMKARKRPQQ